MSDEKPDKKHACRGFYSEIITDADYKGELYSDNYYGSSKRTSFIWQAKTEKMGPIIKNLPAPVKKFGLSPAERWMSYDEDKDIVFPVDTFKPKVYLLSVAPRELTRSVATERLRRQYLAVNLQAVLEEMGVTPRDLLSYQMLCEYAPDLAKYYESRNYLNLELFDNDVDFESRSPEVWLAMGMNKGVRYPLPGLAFLPVPTTDEATRSSYCSANSSMVEYLCDWINVAVTDYKPEKKMWKVLTVDGQKRNFLLPRIYVMFKAEAPFLFAQRVKAAVRLRRHAENTIRFKFYLDCMTLDFIPEMADKDITKIQSLATRTSQVPISYEVRQRLEKLEGQVRLLYKQTLCELQFRHDSRRDPRLCKYVDVPERDCESYKSLATHIQTGMKSFKNMRDYFAWMNIYVLVMTHRGMFYVVNECQKVSNMSLFTSHYGAKYLSLEEFVTVQNQATNFVIKHLQESWLESIITNIRMCLRDIGKGWFDLNVRKYEIYEISKLLRFMELVKFRMQYSLRLLVTESIHNFINLVETPCLPCLDVEDDFEWTDNLIESNFKSKVSPILYLHLRMNSDGAYYSTSPDLFPQTLLHIYDNAIRLTHKIKQVHPYLLSNLKFPPDLFLSSVGLLDEGVCSIRDRFMLALERALIPLNAYAEKFNIHLDLFNMDVKEYLQTFKDEQHTAGEFKEEIAHHKRMKQNLEATLPATNVIGPFFIGIEQLRNFLITKRQDISNFLLDMFALKMKECIEQVLQEMKFIMLKLSEKPESIEHIFDIRDWMETIPMLLRTQEDLLRRYLIEYDVLDHFWYALPQEDFDNKWEAIGWPHKIFLQIRATEDELKESEEKFYKIQLNDEFQLEDRIEGLTSQVVQMTQLRDPTKIHDIAVDMRRLWKAMQEAKENGQLLNERQKLFGVPVVPFDNLSKLIKEFEPFKTLWITSSDWLRSHEIWMDNPILNVDGESIERTVTDMYKTIVKSVRVFAEIEAIQSIAIEIKNQIDAFKPMIPIIQSLRNPGMRQRHWDDFKDKTELNMVWTPTITFKDCLEMGVADFREEIANVAESASKEYNIEQALEKMMKEWETCTMDLTPYKGTYIMKIPEETQQMLDDHIIMTQQLSFSPFKGPFDVKIDEWELTLRTTSEVIEEWMEVQKQWMYLEPILTSEDISTQLPVESKKYNSMERTWKRIMRGAFECPLILKYCADRKLLESLKDANHILEIVQKGLSEYLETKRIVFPRLYFLSDDELLEILSHAKDPLAVQPHLRKCFENIAKLRFEEDLRITKMYSAEEECVDLNPTLYPTANVEQWLLLVEGSMKNTVRSILGDSLLQVDEKPRTEWVLEWPGQVVIAGSQTFWTSGVENGIKTNTLRDFLDNELLVNLDGLRGLVRGSLSFLHREILSALIVIEVHSRDVTQNLVDSHITNANDFDWISQLRYYWTGQDLKVRAVNAEFQYGYEYLGNSGRLVITPLTDRCYLTLTGALHLKFGGAPAGPAGTGKTETTKDLAKAMALQCVVFNCSDQLDFMAMGKFFKGLASSGAWACFDEFNRIDIEVLSVVAQQITTIQKAQQARLDRFVFEGSEIVLKESCAVFITMNPGYAGRTELPDNLKALFRPVSMMVPNYTLISEISLFSFGFSNAKELANKITTTFKLSSEQLSTQDHYDFGMRAVKTVIAVAGNLKREKPNMDEKQIVLRALRDVNVPKFLKDDLKLFNGIVSDLFPKMVEEPVDYGSLEESIRSSCIKLGLEDVNEFVRKVIQLYETTVVRHGLMLVGPTASGKTKCYEVLKDAMTALKGKPQPSGYPFQPAHADIMNPKSITMGQLYGEFDLQTHEWTDGILPCLVRIGVSAEDKDKRWYIFDGPVDAVWIENMNTVLDDNKKLCLSSGEIIKLRDTMTMMFEVADLAVASPATVSRCGMVYMEPGGLGLDPFVNCWLYRLPPLAIPYEEQFKELIEHYVVPAIHMVRKDLREILTSVDSALLQKFLNLMDYMLGPLAGRDNKPPPGAQFLALIPDLLVPWVAFCLVWSVGCTCDHKGRLVFDRWLRHRMLESEDGPQFPADGMVYDYRLHDGGFTDPTEDGQPAPPSWLSWMSNVEEYKISTEMKYSDIEVPTMDNVRNAKLLEIILVNQNNVLCVGPTGTGKSLTVVGKLSRSMHKKFICDFMSFSARTSANQTQDLIDSKLERRRKGIFGPPVLKKQIFFIDDFNMPALEVYGAQPPIELIRQWMDFRGWYDRKNIGEFRTIIDTNFCVAMGPPEGGRNPVTARLLRHFHYLTFNEMEDDSKRKIFGTILQFWLDRVPSNSFAYFLEPLLSTTLDIYKTILKELLPTPAKTHYTFNLRDLSKIFQGVLMFDPESLDDINQVVRLWYHECCRVFQDRLVNDEDRKWFDELLSNRIESKFDINPNAALGTKAILFGDFLDPATDARMYVQITDMSQLSEVLDHYLSEYNQQTTRPMKLVLFLDAISHICRISRIIRQPLGNALLLGMGGSGRQSLTRLATFMAEYTCFQIEIHKTYGSSEWRDDIKGLMLKAGLLRLETVFLFSDTQIKSESFLEDLNNVLNSGDVPNIYQPDELDKIYQEMRGAVQEMGMTATKSNLFAAYKKKVRANMHSVITMSPIGDVFRARLRQFPALVNCCTIDWFSEWPDSALQSVAMQFLEDITELNVPQEVVNGIVKVCQFMHASVVEASSQYKQELSRHNYVTPTSYLELLSSYTDLMLKKRGSLSEGVGRLQTGLEKLQSTAEEVKILQVSLATMKPALEVAARDAEIMIKKIAEDQLMAEETKEIVETEELEASKQALETQAIADDAQRDLDEALPDLLAAEASLKSLNKNDITEVKAMKRPPAGVVYVIESICIVKNIKPVKVPGPKLGEKVNDYWEPSRAMLADPEKFLQSLMNFDKDSITEDMIEKLKIYVNNPIFQPAKVAKVSKACKSLCMWVHAMFKYFFVNQKVAPKKASLQKAKDELKVTEATLAKARAKMRDILDNLRGLQEQLAAKIAFKEEKESSIQICQERMSRAVRLITGLSDERVRWLNTIANIEANVINVTGDILLSAGAVAYLTPFTDQYRRDLLKKWTALIENVRIPCSPDSNPVAILGDPAQIRSWQLDGLPRDSFSTENGVLVANSKRWPLFIDPQGQANRWVKNMGKQIGLSICKLADKDLLRTLESAIRFGKSVLIENIALEVDPSLDPILLRQKFRQSGTWMLKLGDVIIPYDENFRLYMTTKLPNPHYTPEVSIKVLLVNFTLVPSGLQDQLLALVVMQERPDLEEQRSHIIVGSTQMKQELKEIEDRILYKLGSLEGSPLDDLDFIITLEASKVKSDDIKSKVKAAEITQIDIDNTRAQYIPVAIRAQILFFCLSDLSNVDPMYQYSLEWFVSIFISSMADTEKGEILSERIIIINEEFTFSLYKNVCRSLFEKHKLHFAFLLCARILMNANKIDPHEWHHFLAGGSPTSVEPNPASEWLSAKAWNEILSLKALHNFVKFVDTFLRHKDHYKGIFESADPHRRQLPKDLNSEFNEFQKLLVLKCLRPDKVTNAMQDFISEKMGQQFVEPQTSDLAAMFKDSGPNVPLIFVLSTGTDPAADLYKFADRMKFTKRMFSISLGQGQGPIAEKMILSGSEAGSWIFFQNCHLAPSWMPRLERLVENISPEKVHRDFRIWLTSTPSPHFPVSILQNGSKMTVEPPSGIKANILRAYVNQISDLLDVFQGEHPKTPAFKWLLFSLCLFHGALLERRKFGPLGFNIPYEFTDGDLKICISQLKMFLWEYDEIPFKVLTYTAGHINYGGRVTDDWDRRCLMNILADYYKLELVNEKYVFDAQGYYHQLPADTLLIDCLDYIKTFPINDDPELFGLHPNADITFAQAQTYSCLATLLKLQPKQVGGAAASEEEVIARTANTMLKHLPHQFKLHQISEKYPVLYEESLNTVLMQESIRYNKLLKIIETSLKDLLKAIKGLVVMSEALDKMSASLFSNMVPAMWASKAYPSLKPLGAWVADLDARVKFLVKWVNEGIPPVFWISGFYFPQAFLTATLQNFARKYTLSIDTINFSFKVLNDHPSKRPADGCNIWGLFLEGARWNPKISYLDESHPKELYTQMPVVWLIPEEFHKRPGNVYECPVYKTLTRAGVLSTTGHSTNYVLAIEVPSKKPESHWIKRGVALICALDY